MKERAAHFCKAQMTVQLVQIFPNKKEVPVEEKEPGRELGPAVASMVLLAGTFRNTLLLPMLVSLKSLYTQVRLHLTIKDILASLSAKSGLPFIFQFSFTRPMKEIEQNFPGGRNAAWLYEQPPFHFRGNQVVFQ